ncbi:MAG: thioredoxin family protein [Ignavibacteria bacterium]|nr:thioredoxin family protein [Ignavibacteria bacterium]
MAVPNNLNNLGSHLIPFSLKGTDGEIYSQNNFDDKKILVIIFMCNHCPYVKAVMDRLTAIQNKFGKAGVQLVGINSNDSVTYPDDSFENMITFYADYKMNFPYLCDDTQITAREYDAVCTPDIYVYDAKRILKYRGRIDDNWKDETKITSKDLEKAIELLLSDSEIDFQQIPSIGCSIKWIPSGNS